jgi:tripartite-type tricarboxylate transporter receptor subunit TctC
MKISTFTAIALALTLCFVVPSNSADTYPEKPITILLATAAGGGSDITLRRMQPFFEKALGTKLLFEYEGGGGTSIAATMVAKRPADGYTMLSIGSPHYQFTFVLQKVGYTIDDLYPVGPYNFDPAVVRVSKDAPWNNLSDLVEFAKSKPAKTVKVSVGQRTSNNFLSLKQIEQTAGVSFNIVPYSGGNPARLALINGEVDMTNVGLFNSLPIAAKTKVLAVHYHENRWPNLTNSAKTVNDQLGVKLNDSAITDGLWVAGKLRKEYPARHDFLVKALNKVLTDPAYIAEMKKLGLEDQLIRQDPEMCDKESRGIVEDLKKYKELFTN